jgi:pseudouridine synthase
VTEVRLQKFLADAGVASRRAAETLIEAGRVSVNGHPVRLLGTKVVSGRDTVTVDGKPARARRRLYLALHKPRGCVCSRQDERGRPTIYDLLPPDWTNVQSVGRLDYDSEGLLLLTNDGDFSLRLSHPRFGVRKKYAVRVEGRVDEEGKKRLLQGIVDEGERLRARSVRVLNAGRAGSSLEIELTEGRNREIRRMFAALGMTVTRLLRVQVGPLKLGELRPGRWRALTETEIESLLTKR